jgi:hypothetical protein
VLDVDMHQALAELIAAVNRATDAAERRAPAAEVELRVDAAEAVAARIEAMIGSSSGNLRRHLYWLRRRFGEGKPELADGDLRDLREHDVPAVVDAVAAWGRSLIDAKLYQAVIRSWEAQQYDSAVRSAFVCLEERMRSLGDVSARRSVAGAGLVRQLLPEGDDRDRWDSRGFMGGLTDGEQKGARQLLSGSFGLFRNATAHRSVAYSRDEAADVIHLVNLCFRLTEKIRPLRPA